MRFPLRDYKYKIPVPGDLGAFGAVRKYDIHTGVDLYCEPGAPVIAVEDGLVVAVEQFTGESVGSPWWNETKAILIEGASGVLLYGELEPTGWIEKNQIVHQGDEIGRVVQVLKQNKGLTPLTMLHFEMYEGQTKQSAHIQYHDNGTLTSVTWRHGENQPERLKDPTEFLQNLYECEQKIRSSPASGI